MQLVKCDVDEVELVNLYIYIYKILIYILNIISELKK